MSLTSVQQFHELLKQSAAPLIILPPYPSRDAVASAIALSTFLRILNKPAAIVCDRIDIELERLSFLPRPELVLSNISGARDFVLSFNTENNKIGNVRSEQIGDELRISITPDHGTIDPRDFSFVLAKFKYDLAIIIGAPDRESLGKISEENADLFYELPIINIDRDARNESYGQVNLVDITASSIAEILAKNFEQFPETKLSEDVTECLLTGLIAATESFQKKNTTPQSLELASRLMEMGADQQKIVRFLYKTQPLPLLKLWGRVMAGIHWDETFGLVSTHVSLEDLVQTRARGEDIPLILEKIRGNFAAGKFFLILSPDTVDSTRGFFATNQPEVLELIIPLFDHAGIHGNYVSFTIPSGQTETAETIAIEKLRTALEK